MQKTILMTGDGEYLKRYITILLQQKGYLVISFSLSNQDEEIATLENIFRHHCIDTVIHVDSFSDKYFPSYNETNIYHEATITESDILLRPHSPNSYQETITGYCESNLRKNDNCQCACKPSYNTTYTAMLSQNHYRSLWQDNPIFFYKRTIPSMINMLHTMIAHRVKKFVLSSTNAVYGIPTSLPICEDHPKNPLTKEAKSNVILEMMLEDIHAQQDVQYVVLRNFDLVGEMPSRNRGIAIHEKTNQQTHEATDTIKRILQAGLSKKPFTYCYNEHETADGTLVRDYVHVFDAAMAHVLALQHLDKQRPSDCFNIGYGKTISVRNIINRTEKLLDIKIPLAHTKRDSAIPPMLQAQCARAKMILGWEPIFSDIETIIKTTYKAITQ